MQELIGNLCYTHKMNEDRHIWQVWQKALHRWGGTAWAAWFLQAVGPLSILGAQLVYLTQPVLNILMPQGHLNALAQLLEEPEQVKAFVNYLREES